MTEADRKALLNWIEADGIAKVADTIGAAQETVARWAHGVTQPQSLSHIRALDTALKARARSAT